MNLDTKGCTEVVRSILRTRHPKLEFAWCDMRAQVTGDTFECWIILGKERRNVSFSISQCFDEREIYEAVKWAADDLAGWHRPHVPFRIGAGRLRGYAGHHRQLKSTLPPELIR